MFKSAYLVFESVAENGIDEFAVHVLQLLHLLVDLLIHPLLLLQLHLQRAYDLGGSDAGRLGRVDFVHHGHGVQLRLQFSLVLSASYPLDIASQHGGVVVHFFG